MSRYFHTLRHLKPIQIRYQLWYRIRSKIGFLSVLPKADNKDVNGKLLNFSEWIDKPISFSNRQFTFLNLSQQFSEEIIDWNFNGKGKLWCYNLNYMDYLLQVDMSKEKGIELIELFIIHLTDKSTGNEPYPISLRGINWIKFLSIHKIQNQEIDKSLYIQYQILFNTIEYHLLGNHLLENGFSLLFGAFYFNDNKLYSKAKQILMAELDEQILDDGGHFELSPMYHQIILDRLLDTINLLRNNEVFADQHQLLEQLTEKAGKMLAWLKNITFQNGEIPHFNDSTNNIAPTTNQLLDYASRLNLPVRRSFREGGNQQPATSNLNLSTSGYRTFRGNNYECIVDVGHIGPNYIPGHAHADMLSFVLYVSNKPLIVDSGISTYEKNEQRQLERSTLSHNTVVVDDKSQSDVWGGFRVGKRAKINIIKDEQFIVEVEHNGYKPILHNRKIQFNQQSIKLEEALSKQKSHGQSHLHFHPDREVIIIGEGVIIDKKYTILINNALNINLLNYNYPLGYNKYNKAKKLIIDFEGCLEQIIKF
jgi:hypothetical protein